jgi:hypothetical protein
MGRHVCARNSRPLARWSARRRLTIAQRPNGRFWNQRGKRFYLETDGEAEIAVRSEIELVLGSGKPLFVAGAEKRDLRLVRAQTFGESGVVMLNYRPRRWAIAEGGKSSVPVPKNSS